MSEFDMPTREIAKRLTVDQRLALTGFPEGCTPRQANAITMSRLQFALSELAEKSVEDVHCWLQEVARNSPAEAIRLYLELLEFRMPRLKAAQVNLTADLNNGNGKAMAAMSIEELERVVAEG